MRQIHSLIFIVFLTLACATKVQVLEPTKPVMSEAMEMPSRQGINLEYMDLSVHPGDDFFRYVNGNWLKDAVIPEDRSRWGSFDELRKKTDEATLDILKRTISADNVEPGSDAQKIRDFYNAIMDTTRRNELGVEPLKPYLDQINSIKTTDDVLSYMAVVEPLTQSPFFGFGVFSSAKNSNLNILHMGTGALGLPEREYYVSDDEDSQEKRRLYMTHIANMFSYLDIEHGDASHRASHILDLETKMAEAKLTKEESRDARNTFHFMPMDVLSEKAPGVDWRTYIHRLGYRSDSLNVSQPRYITRVVELMDKEEIQDIKDYLRWTLINATASYLSMDMDRTNFDFYGKILGGQKEQRPLDERALAATNRVLGESLGRLYVDELFPPEAKSVAKEMVDNIIVAYADRIRNLAWMSPETKEKALEKLATFKVKIGYPDKWKDYSDLEIVSSQEGSYLQNMFNSSQWNFNRGVDKLNKPVDKDEWFMSPQTVNAYYNPYYNEIVFPAAILQAPFFDFKADPAVNFGGIGAVIGHEISHGFDDSGSRFDKDGNLKNWWTDADRSQFDELGKALVAQYDAYEPLPGVFVNGEFTLGENIGDLGGILVAYDGLQRHMQLHGRYDPIEGFSPEQRFFISFGTIWRGIARDEYLKRQIKTDPHSPSVYRACGPVVNMDAWYDAFEVTPSHAMYKEKKDRIRIW